MQIVLSGNRRTACLCWKMNDLEEADMSNIWAVIPSAGLGKRMGTAVKKQFITLCGKELLVYTLEVFEKIEEIRGVVLVCGK